MLTTTSSDLPATAGRWDIYGPVHKGLRRGHCALLQRLATTDFTRDTTALIADLRMHLMLGETHLADEERFIHTALERHSPGAACDLERDHAHHRARFTEIEAAIDALEAAADPRLADERGRTLHLLFSRFVAEDLVHMAEEEESVWPRLCALFSDVELAEIEAEIVGSLPPEIAMGFMQLMVPATNAAERAALLGGMKANAPAEAYAAVYELAARPSLTPDQLADLEALGLAA
ncbi:hypothetical protein [Sphingomonas colocasiae]|uniref:Hemerythrin-like domain-containing protein n=1 Tax=Sphingomonas colocasiae TaxID=1848973 RepID=A0ABS7PU64_9SPHN|nr:hypothetical protein [Sphingomonas colocasiae]MBY8824686.1 hypothetical protein [Sphingomonas colocasiae]